MQPKRFYNLLFLLLISGSLYSQVNLQTGTATFSVPLFEWNDDKSKLNSALALSYNSGNGLKVSDLPSNVGQGWNLVAGGAIVRMQLGEPDDQVVRNGNGSDYDVTKYPSGILYAATPAANGCPDALRKYPIYGWKNQVYAQHNAIAEDKQLDYFSFQFNGKAGMFVLDPSNIGVARPLGDTKLKITFQQDAGLINQGIRTKITSFTIQDVDGIIYKFSRHGLTKVLQANFCNANLVQEQKQPKFEGGRVYHQTGFDNAQIVNPFIIGSWYLSEIEDALTHRKITFNYVNRTINNIAGQDVMYNAQKNYTIIAHKKSITQTPVLTSIVYPDGHVATFNYGAARHDLKGDYVLSNVDFTYQGRYLSKYLLNTTYFILNRYGTPVTPYQKSVARLCLKSVKKIGVDLKEDSPPYVFDYYLGSNAPDDFVPPPFFYAKDIWGFYNGTNSAGFYNETIPLNTSISSLSNNQLRGLCFLKNGITGINLNPKNSFAKNGLLKQIVYPTGGSLTFEYEQNSGMLNGSLQAVGGVHVSQTSATDGGYSNNCSNPMVTLYHYVMNGVGSNSSLWGLEMPINSTTTHTHYQPEWKSYHWTWNCAPFGCCYWHFEHPGILSQQQAISLTDFQQFMAAAAPVLGVISVISTIVDVVTLCLGPTPLAIVAVVIDVICGLVTLAITCIGNHSRDYTYTIYYNSDLNGVAPLPAQFKRVEVVENPGTIGKTVYEFTSDADYAIWHPTNPALSAKQRFAPWAYGLSKHTTYFDALGYKVKQISNEYSHNHYLTSCHPGQTNCIYKAKVPLQLNSCKCVVLKTTSQRSTNWTDPVKYNDPASYRTTSNADMNVDIYDHYTGRVELVSTSEKVFKPNSSTEYLETKIDYQYNQSNYEVHRIQTIQSNGDYTTKEIKYSTDFNTGIIATLNQNNMVSVPVATVIGGSGGTLEENVTEFATTTNGDIKPSRIIEQRFKDPLPQLVYDPVLGGWVYAFKPYQGPGHPNNSVNYKQVGSFTYDAIGKLIGLKDEGNRLITNIYDYNDKYIVASVINADPVLDKSAYSSFETATFGGWTFNGSPLSYTNLYSVTGTQSLVLSTSNSLSAALNSGKGYKLSVWSGTPLNISAGAVLVKSVPGITGFVYYEYDIPQGNSSVTVSASTGAVMDELRLYPSDARMRTTTYDPLIGKTSECDENNRITYYEYDNLGRLSFIKDQNKNIVKMYEYNNISPFKQNGCPAVYYSKFASETFTRDNCGPGYLGTDITFTVPANQYTSTISQEDADAKAELYLLTNGQEYANTSGGCQYIYYNTLHTRVDNTQNCPPGYVGGLVTYTVPAGTYSSIISQADANQQAIDDMDANSQAYANDPAHAVCTVDTNPNWVWQEGGPSYCQSVNGNLPPHLFILETDLNPNSPTYYQTRWSDVGPSDECPAGNYYNATQSASFIKNDCPPGTTGSSVTYTVPPGIYNSIVSQAAADQQAFNDINANGQNYANTYGDCTSTSWVDVYYNAYYSGYGDMVEFYNVNTYQSFYFSIYSYGSGYLGSITQGTYNITYYPNYGGNYQYLSVDCGFSTGGYGSLTLYSVPVAPFSCNTIYIGL